MSVAATTLEFVARSDWMTVLPSLISVNDIGKGDLVVNPIVDPPLLAEFVVIQPARRILSVAARLFLERFEAEVASGEPRASAHPQHVELRQLLRCCGMNQRLSSDHA